jgi:hypothetical protein
VLMVLLTCLTVAFHFKYWPSNRIQAGLKTGDLHQGTITINSYHILEGSVTISGHTKPVLIRGRFHLNRATHQDMVVVELLPKSEWRQPSDVLVEEGKERRLSRCLIINSIGLFREIYLRNPLPLI